MYKGIVLHTIGKVAFVLGNFIIQGFLARYMSPDMYGVYGAIVAIINFDYLFLNNGVRQAVSHEITRGQYNVPNLISRGMLYQLAIIAVVCAINFFGAPLLEQLLGKEGIGDYIRIAASIIPFMGIYFVALGVFNGFKLFVIEATIVTVYPLLKMIIIPFAGGVFTDPIFGAEMGFLVAGIIICGISLIWLYKKRGLYKSDKPKIEGKSYVKAALSFSLIFSIVSVVMNVDTLILTAYSSADVVGYYTAAVQFGKASYYLLGAFYIVVLPVVTKYYTENQLEKATPAIRDLMTIILALVLPVAVIISASSETVLVAYAKNEAYGVGGPALSFLSFGTFFLGMTLVFCMIASAANKKRFTNVLSILLMVAFIPACMLLTWLFSLTGTGAASFVVCLVTMIVSGAYAIKLFGNFFAKKHAVALGVNAVLFVVMKLIDTFYHIPNLAILLVICAAVYALGFGIMRLCKVISIKQVMNALKKEKKSEEAEQEFDLEDNIQ